MELRISDTKKHKKLVSWIKLLETLNEEMTLIVDGEGISVRSMDNSHVEMIDCTIQPSNFDHFMITGKEELNLSIVELRQVLERFDMVKDTMTITTDKDKSKLLLKANRLDSRVREFSVNLMETLEGEVPEPKIMFDAKVRVTLEDLTEALVSANMYTENVDFIIPQTTGDSKLRVEGKGERGTYWDEITPISGEVSEHSKATFTMSYLMDLVKALKPLANVLSVQMSTDMPLHLDVEVESGKLKLWLAPCISS